MVFIRKGMDYMFSQSELFWLDHILPDEHRRRKEDEKRAMEADASLGEELKVDILS